jgi:hypothetical protein
MALERGTKVARMLLSAGVKLHALGITMDGQPRHPLYLRADAVLIPWSPSGPLASEAKSHNAKGSQS